MIQIEKNEIKRDGIKIGYIQGDHTFDHTGKKLAYFSSTEVFDESVASRVCTICTNLSSSK